LFIDGSGTRTDKGEIMEIISCPHCQKKIQIDGTVKRWRSIKEKVDGDT